ncbi:MAG: hypothetical protein LBJ67_14645 [Planctomycetaceae bacterium]|jgi:hypothetical protein|nr:hypothetical protein [Planctomycetaceae bacterium]
MFKILSITGMLLVGFVISGCDKNNIATLPVEIAITYHGEKVEGALVTLAPKVKDGTQRTATGMTNAEGKAVVLTPAGGKGAMPGDYKVTVMKTPLIGGGTEESAPQYNTYEEAVAAASSKNQSVIPNIDPKHQLPAKYAAEKTTDLEITVAKGKEKRWVFELKD